MNNVFSKFNFSQAPGGDKYQWMDAKIVFNIENSGLYVVKIVATAKNAERPESTDDDDLRIAIDGFHFGKYEIHDEKISWKGFGTSAGWNGASLQGGTKIIYFFLSLDKGSHNIQFFADGTPEIQSLEVFDIRNRRFKLQNLIPPENIASSKNGIPWISLIFLGSYPKQFFIDVITRSAKEKGGADGDNLKVILNGKILKNKKAATSSKYKNYYFSGDLKEIGILSLDNEEIGDPLAFENSIEIWYDQCPQILSLEINFFDTEAFLKELGNFVDLKKYVQKSAWLAAKYFKFNKWTYSERFLRRSLSDDPKPLIFESNHQIVRKIKNDKTYLEIVEIIKGKILSGNLDGEVWPKDFQRGKINFTSQDLATAIHGIRKIEYKAEPKITGGFNVKFILFDIYDFEKVDVPFFLPNLKKYIKSQIINNLDIGETFGIINNFEIQININTHI